MLAGTSVTAASIKAFGLSGINLKVVSDPYAYPPEYRGWEDLYRDEWTWDSVFEIGLLQALLRHTHLAAHIRARELRSTTSWRAMPSCRDGVARML